MLETITREALHTVTRYTHAYRVVEAALTGTPVTFPTLVAFAAAFDIEDLTEFAGALKRDLLAAAATGDTTQLESTMAGWAALARVITHPQTEELTVEGTQCQTRLLVAAVNAAA